MLKRIIVCLLFLMISLSAKASWSGQWRGFATITEADGPEVDCGEVSILINHQKQPKWESLWVMSGLPGCGLPSAMGVSFQLEIKNGMVFHMGQSVGEYQPLELKMVRVSEGHKEDIELIQVSADELLYRKYFTYQGPLESYYIEAKLYKE